MIDRYLRKFRLRSFFVRIFLAHVIVLGLLLCVFYGYVSNLFSRHYAERVEAAVSGMLQSSCTAIDVTLLNMVHSMRQTLENQNVIRAMVTPNLRDYPRTVAIVEQLRSSVAGNILVRAAALYVPTGGSVFSFDGTVTEADESAWADAVDAYREDYRSTVYANGPLMSRVRLLGERIFIYQDFFPEHLNNIGTLIFEIDALRFYEMVFEDDGGDGGSIYLFDEYGTPVFPSVLDYKQVRTGDFLGDGKAGNDYLQRSPVSGWVLRYLPFGNGVGKGVVPVRRVFFPFALVVLLLSLPLSLYVTTRVYRPMKKLMKRISPLEGGASPTGSELDYLDRVYSDAKDRNERLHSAIAAISPAVLERLFQNLLLGREIGRREIEETLATLTAPFSPDARYTVLLLSLAPPSTDDEPPTEVEVNLCTMAVRDRLRMGTPVGTACCVLRIADTTLALVLHFDDALSPADVRQATGKVRDVLRAGGRDYDHIKVSIGQGEIYAHIEDLRFSYLEALEDLQHSRFYAGGGVSEGVSEFGGSSEPNATDKPDNGDWVDSSPASVRTYFSKRSEHILQSLNEGDSARASDILRRVVGEIFVDTPDAEETAKSCGLFADCLLEILVVQKGSGFKQLSRLRGELDVGDADKTNERLLAFGERVIAKIRSHNKKRSKRYIRAAEEYIENNFSDASLSLNMTAEHVGLNASYFSRLFGEATGRHFTDYLGELRVEKACELLAATDMPIKDVAYRTGFNSMQNYFRVFKRCKGMTPGEYRGRGKK